MLGKVCYLFNKSELELLKSVVYLEPILEDAVNGIKPKGDKWLIKIDAGDIGDALSALEYAAGYTEGYDKKEDYLKLHDKIKEGFKHSQQSRRKIIEQEIRKQLGD